MPAHSVRTTVALPADLLEAADRAVQEGRARSRNELMARALRRELAAEKRAVIDAAFATMGDDHAYVEEAEAIAREFAAVDWQAFQTGEHQHAGEEQ